MPLCPVGLKLCEQSGFLGEIYFLCRLQPASPAERMSLLLRGHCSLLQSALGFYFIFEGIGTIKEIQTDIHPSQSTAAHACAHICSLVHEPRALALLPQVPLSHHTSSAQPTPQPQNPTRNPIPEPGGQSHASGDGSCPGLDPASAATAGAALAPIPSLARRDQHQCRQCDSRTQAGGSLPQNLAGEGAGSGYRGWQNCLCRLHFQTVPFRLKWNQLLFYLLALGSKAKQQLSFALDRHSPVAARQRTAWPASPPP